MKKHLLAITAAFFLLFITSVAEAQTTLAPGDIAVVGYDFSYNTITTAPIGSDNFDIVVLKNIAAGTVIQFTSNGWQGSAFTSVGTIDGFFTWTVGSNITAGTVFNFSVANGTLPATITVSPSNGTISGVTNTEFTSTVGFSPSTGNQILIFQGTQAAPTFIYGINTNATNVGANGWVTGVVGNNAAQSALPTGLTNANPFNGTVSAPSALPFTLETARYDAVYSGPLTGSQTTLLTDIGNYANWTATATATAPYDLSVGGANFSSSNPVFNLATPTITSSGTLAALTTTSGTASSSTSFSVSATALTAGVLVTPPSGFEVSTDNSTFSSTVTVGSSGTLAATTVYVRLAAADAANTYSGNIVLSSSGATSVNVATASSTVTAAATTISSITDVSASLTNAATVQYTAAFGASVTGVTTSNFSLTTTGSVTGASITAISGSGTTYTITVNTGTGDGTIGLNLANATSVSPGVSTTLPFTGSTYTIDKTAPTVTISAPSVSSTSTGPVSYTVTWADPNLNTASISLSAAQVIINTSGTANYGSIAVTGSGATRTITIGSITGTGTLGISLPSGTASDNAGNTAGTAGPSTTFTVTAPTTISSITDVSAATTNAATVQYTATFGASVTGVTTSNFSLTTTGSVSGASIASVSGSGTTYTITVNTGTGDGTIGLNLANSTGLSPGISTTLPFAGSTYTIDKTAPTATISAPSVTIANSSAAISYTVTFTDANMKTSTLNNFSALTVFENSHVTGTATINSISVSSTYVQSGNNYSFSVTFNDMTGDGTLSFTVPAGTVSDNAGNTSTASAASGNVIIDNTPPTVTFSAPSVSSTSTGPVSYTITWADPNLNTSSISLSVFDIIVNTTGSANYSSLSLSGSGATRTVTVGGTSGTGTISISIPSGTASDNAGNVTLAAGPSATFAVAPPGPAIAASGTLSGLSGTYGSASTSESFNVSGSNMSAGILVTSPTGFEVSTDNGTFNSTVTVGAAGTIVSTPVYIRLISGDAAGNYSGNVVLSSSGATSVNEAIASSTVAQASLTITADNQSKVYGAPIPTLTASYSGFVNGDTPASLTTLPTLSTTATAASQVAGNPYAITASGTVDPNYTITYVPGSLTVSTAALTVTADNQSSTYGQALPALTVSYAGFVNGDTQASLTTAATASTTATAASPAGSYTITPSGAVDNNYQITYTNGTLTIGQAALTVTADNQSSTYGQALPALTVSYAGFVNGDTQASLTTAATASTTATAASPAGSYTITPSGAIDNNYQITYTNGTLTIGQAALTVTADNQSSTYGQALPALTVSYAGFVNGDTQASLTTAATASTTATAASPAGSYTITPSGAVDNNYQITYTNGTLTIGQAALTVTADNQSSTYGQALPALTVSYAGFVNGDTQASLTTAATASTTATSASPAGSYTITPSGAVDNNYQITYTNGTLTIGQAALTVTADNQSSTYGQALPALTVSYAGFVNGDTQASLTTAATASTTATSASPAGSYTITPSGAVDNNYQITYTNGTLTIGQAALTVTADNQSSTYGQALPALTVSYAGFVNGDTQASLTTAATASTIATAASPAGSYTITPSGAVDNNYQITYTNGTLTIGQAALTVTADNQSSTYGQALPALTVSYAGFVNGDTQASLTTAATASTTATSASPAGSYTITPSGAVDNNYQITYTNGTLTIGQAALTVTADNQSSTYGQALPALTVSYAGFVNGDTQASLTTAATASTTATAASPAGSYTITPSGAVDNNYQITYTNGTLTIGQAALTVTADNQSSTYGQALPALTVSYAGFVNGDTQASLTTAATASTTATAASPAGSYTITPSGAVDNNYQITYTNGTLTIGQAALTVTADNQSSTYGQAVPALTVSYAGFVNGDTQASLTTAATASTTATSASPAGSYTITPSGAVDNNYQITYTNGTLTIGQAALTVTADNQSSTYGQALPALTVSYAGFVNGDTQASLTTAATASTTATSASPAGSYTITPSGAVDNNYQITYTNGTLTIGQAALTVTADNQSSTYGQALPALTVSYAGFVNGDTQASLTTAATASTIATAASPAGSYTITPSGAVDNNYQITYTNGTLTIGQAALTVTADNQSSTYGQALPALTVSYAGFVNGDTQASLTTAATASTTATSASPAGSYTITPSGAVDNNYQITYTNGTLTIGQAALTVTADNQSSTYGQALPALTVSYAGFVNGDTQASLTTAATASTTATAASPAGSYTITPSGAVDNNYQITYTNGTLTIGQAALTVTADNQSSTYGQALPALTVSYAGFVNGDTQASLTTAATASTTATAASPAGSYTITPSGAVDNNYQITYTNGTLTIGQAALTVTADNQSSTYGQALPALTVSYAGFVNGDTQASLTTAATASTTATAASPAGSYTITPSGAVDNNYQITYTNGTLTIGQAALTVTADNQSSTYGQALPALTVSYAGFVNGDTQASLTTAATASTTATAASPAGSYTITPSGAVDNNYQITYTNGTLTIGQAALTVTADNQSSTYGQAVPALTVSYAGFVNGDTQASLTTAATASTTATSASPAGSYTITPSGAVDNNYQITYTNGTLTIGQAALTVTADNQSSTYGQALPALTVSYAGFVNGDTQASLTTAATASTIATAASPAGSYTITPSGAVDNNYQITYTNGTLTIGQAALTVTADNQSSTYGQALPALTVSYAGFVNGDTQASLTTAATASTTATSTSAVGTYVITPSGVADANYTITYVNGTLTITDATRSLTFNSLPVKTYGDADFNPGATASSGETVNYSSSNTAVATIVNGAIHITGAGTTTITASLAVNGNYSDNPTMSQELVVNKAQQTIDFAAIPTQLRGGHYDLSVVTASSGLPVSFSQADPKIVSIDGTTLNDLQLGVTTVTASQAGNDNYEAAVNVVQEVRVNDATGDDIIVHQAVSPNGDGINDYLYIEGIRNYPQNEVTLMNRNGVIIFQGFNYDNSNHVFDGHSNITGSLQQAGTYFYRVELIVSGERVSKTGYIVLKYQ